MLKIGEFSKLTQVSVRMLPHYDEIGLLKPAETDRLTDYRYYKEEQLPAMCRIKALKDMGFSLADIIRIMQLDGDNAALDDFLESRRAELCATLAETEYRLKLIDIAKNAVTFLIRIQRMLLNIVNAQIKSRRKLLPRAGFVDSINCCGIALKCSARRASNQSMGFIVGISSLHLRSITIKPSQSRSNCFPHTSKIHYSLLF